MNRADLEKQMEIMYKDKTQEEMMEIGASMMREFMKKEKQAQEKSIKDRIEGMRSIFNLCKPVPSNRFKK